MFEHIYSLLHITKIKIVLALFPASLFILTDLHLEIIAIILWLLIIDTLLGISVAIKYKIFTSTKMRKAIHKFLIYTYAMLTAFFISQIDIPMISYFFYYTGAYIAVNEGISNFEKLALLGFVLPKQLMNKLNIDFKNNDIDKLINKK